MEPKMLAKEQWQKVTKCPSCSTSNTLYSGKLSEKSYQCGDEIIYAPQEEIEILQCSNCRLYYKNLVPSSSFLSELFSKQSKKIWSEPYDFVYESKFLEKLNNYQPFDILDIGASHGNLLKALSNIEGRRSALDIAQYPGIKPYIKGEFIQNFIDDPQLIWSSEKYDVVTMFDIMEHLYRPQNVFQNLASLVKDNGYVLIETGDADNYWPQKYGIENWWYVKFVEHHIFWNTNALKKLAEEHGFTTIFCEIKKHKSRRAISGYLQNLNQLLKIGLYVFNPKIYQKIAKFNEKSGIQPWSPFTKDHIFIIFQKK
ncbi:class I SAM-dependent methyltransferase [Tolypothrix sp. FACHB-123]|uniref:class I SAM-dependent methyltransferase n=1 Tax=Tolypothrix sp. FACHB-123 TaxID=2692868 RepID=UPI0016898316|nr:class I SAM-dependent methyltransferase [Tolypothrix sp. FACHB-123]MBD2353380.1 class I SAM-dependent methyltransferase [Tolypothrix sp. FACHB-123]